MCGSRTGPEIATWPRLPGRAGPPAPGPPPPGMRRQSRPPGPWPCLIDGHCPAVWPGSTAVGVRARACLRRGQHTGCVLAPHGAHTVHVARCSVDSQHWTRCARLAPVRPRLGGRGGASSSSCPQLRWTPRSALGPDLRGETTHAGAQTVLVSRPGRRFATVWHCLRCQPGSGSRASRNRSRAIGAGGGGGGGGWTAEASSIAAAASSMVADAGASRTALCPEWLNAATACGGPRAEPRAEPRAPFSRPSQPLSLSATPAGQDSHRVSATTDGSVEFGQK